MEHYFSKNPKIKSERRNIKFCFQNKEFSFVSDNGVFSKDHIDEGSIILIDSFLKDEKNETFSFLDIGCGYGVVSVIVKSFFPFSNATLSDVNKRAIELSVENMKKNNINNFSIVISDIFENIKGSFDYIISNPPIRAGKKTIFKIYEDSYKYLNNMGSFYCVIMTKHGAKSTEKKLKEIYEDVKCIQIKNGYRVYKATKNPKV